MNSNYMRLATTDNASVQPAAGLWVWRLINLVMAVFFLLAAYYNLNDNDWYMWVPIYILPGFLSIMLVVRQEFIESRWWSVPCVILLTFCLVYGIYQVVILVQAIDGQLENPLRHEEGREMGGLMIIIAWLGISRFSGIGRSSGVSNSSLMSALLIMTVTLAVVPLLSWSLCFVGDWHKRIGHCKDMF